MRGLPDDSESGDEVLTFIEKKHLMGKGLGYVNFHLITSSLLTGVPVWTLDKKLAQLADNLQFKVLKKYR
jgi:hypothetical protein